ncbi:MAG: sugar ABC transporter permease [Spirochaetales bacterium]|nr:sugar ABC transporter permease [Spirochaetales bacterium]
MNLGREAKGYIWVAPMTIVLLLTTLVPVVYILGLGFFENYLPTGRVIWAGLANYRETLSDPLFYKVLGNTAVYVIFSVLLHLAIGLFLAVFLDKRNRFAVLSSGLRVVFIIPWLLSWSVASSIWLLILNPSGVLNSILIGLGLLEDKVAWFGSPDFAMVWIILITAWKAFPFYMMLIYAALTTIPEELYESASIDGANLVQKFYYVSFQSILPTMLTLGVLDIIWSIRQYDIFALTTGGGPLDSTRTLSLHVYSTAFENLRFGLASSQGIMIMLISSLISVFYIRLYSRAEG